MNKSFFGLSELLHKFRRNLLFVAIVAIVHFYFVPFKELKILNVDIPDNFLGWAIPLCLLWFAANYFYYLYAEFIEWKAQSVRVHIPAVGNYTISSSVALLSNYLLQVKTVISDGALPLTGNPNAPPEDVLEANLSVFQSALDTANGILNSQIREDLGKIEAFNKVIQTYHWTNQARLYVLDITIPALVAIIGLAKPIKMALTAIYALLK